MEEKAWFILRLGLAFTFIYAAVSGFLEPQDWIGYFPPFMLALVPGNVLLAGWGIFEVIIAFWILSGRKIFVPSLLASLSLVGLIVTNIAVMDVIFRDVGLLAIAVALTLKSREERP